MCLYFSIFYIRKFENAGIYIVSKTHDEFTYRNGPKLLWDFLSKKGFVPTAIIHSIVIEWFHSQTYT